MGHSKQQGQTQSEDGGTPPIADRVRFWEEQDKINQELIPRVIRQNELLTKHIAEHDSLPEVAGNAISETLAKAREEHRHQYETALEVAKREFAEEARKTRNVLVGIATGAMAVSVVALIVSILT